MDGRSGQGAREDPAEGQNETEAELTFGLWSPVTPVGSWRRQASPCCWSCSGPWCRCDCGTPAPSHWSVA